jgi:hypothetical protein
MGYLSIAIKTDILGPPSSGDYLRTPYSWRFLRHQRLLASPPSLSEGSEIWIESIAWAVLPVVIGFRCVCCESENQIELFSIHGPIKVTQLVVRLEETNIHLHAALELPLGIEKVPFGRWLCRQFVSALVGRNV